MEGGSYGRILLSFVIVACWTYLHLEARHQRAGLRDQIRRLENEVNALRAWRQK